MSFNIEKMVKVKESWRCMLGKN